MVSVGPGRCPRAASRPSDGARAGGEEHAHGADHIGGRALRNPFFEHWQGREPELAGDDRAHAELLAAVERHDFDTAYIYAGQGVGLVRQPRPAAEVVAELATADDLLRRAGSPV